MRRRCSGLIFVFALAVPLHAQQSQQPPFVGKVDVSLVNVDVTVTSRGTPARGLTRDDFEVLEDGVPQAITNFYAIEQPAAQPAGTPPPAQPLDERFRRRVLVIVDNSHSSRHGRDVALGQLERFIDEHFSTGEYDWSIAVATRRVQLVLPPTTDKAAIHDAFSRVRKMSARGLLADQNMMLTASADRPLEPGELRNARTIFETRSDAWQQNFDTNDSADAIVQAVRAFTNAPGRKIILLISGGLGSTGEFSLIPFDAPGMSTDVIAHLADAGKVGTRLRDYVVREANASNVTFYVLNPEGLAAPNDIAGTPMTNNAMSFWIAEQTGGRMLPGNDVRLSLQEFDKTSANFYSLAYRPPHGDDGQYHRITVRLKRRGSYALQYRDGYISAPADAQLYRLLASPLAATMQPSAIPVSVTAGTPRAEGNHALLPVRVEVPYKSLQSLPGASGWSAAAVVYVSLFDANGRHLTTVSFEQSAHAPADFSTSDAVLTAQREVRVGGVPRRVIVAVRDPLTDAVGIAAREVRAE